MLTLFQFSVAWPLACGVGEGAGSPSWRLRDDLLPLLSISHSPAPPPLLGNLVILPAYLCPQLPLLHAFCPLHTRPIFCSWVPYICWLPSDLCPVGWWPSRWEPPAPCPSGWAHYIPSTACKVGLKGGPERWNRSQAAIHVVTPATSISRAMTPILGLQYQGDLKLKHDGEFNS